MLHHLSELLLAVRGFQDALLKHKADDELDCPSFKQFFAPAAFPQEDSSEPHLLLRFFSRIKDLYEIYLNKGSFTPTALRTHLCNLSSILKREFESAGEQLAQVWSAVASFNEGCRPNQSKNQTLPTTTSQMSKQQYRVLETIPEKLRIVRQRLITQKCAKPQEKTPKSKKKESKALQAYLSLKSNYDILGLDNIFLRQISFSNNKPLTKGLIQRQSVIRNADFHKSINRYRQQAAGRRRVQLKGVRKLEQTQRGGTGGGRMMSRERRTGRMLSTGREFFSKFSTVRIVIV